MRTLRTAPISHQEAVRYACVADFCQMFVNDMEGIYLLSFLLTGTHSLAEECFVHGLEDYRRGNPVFKEWTRSWVRRTIIRSAIKLVRPQPASNRTPGSTSDLGAGNAMTLPAAIASIVGLPQFERFVFVMAVLERYCEQECSLLLNCTRGDVIAARNRALQQIAEHGELPRMAVPIQLDRQAPQNRSESLLQTEAVCDEKSRLPNSVSFRDETRSA